MMIKLLVVILFVALCGAEQCPDKRECPFSTCCLLIDGSFGCCPYRNAVCCSDKIHCCSEHQKCNIKSQSCDDVSTNFLYIFAIRSPLQKVRQGKNVNEPTENKLELIDFLPIESDVIRCPDGRICPVGSSCCRARKGGFGCCAYPKSTCCSDMIHCCPENYTCDIPDNLCLLLEDAVQDFKRQGSPYEERNKTLPIYRIEKAKNPYKISESQNDLIDDVQDKKCPDGDRCPSTSTCCQLRDERYGCCPYSDAVCCADKEHCCPSNTTCDPSLGVCFSNVDINNHHVKGSLRINYVPVTKIETTLKTNKLSQAESQRNFIDLLQDITCPDEAMICEKSETCCQLADESYGCCPHPVAVCCSNKKTCCPYGYVCQQDSDKCIKVNYDSTFERFGINSIPASKINSTLIKNLLIEEFISRSMDEVQDQICPDGYTCSGTDTCCVMTDGGYGCCPHPEGVCCSDMETCCPNSYVCDVKNGNCNKSTMNHIMGILSIHSIPSTKIASTRKTDKILESQNDLIDDVQDKKCPDGDRCPSTTTCCQLRDERYGCCPYPDAVCCADKEHCCPSNTTCDPSLGVCFSNVDINNYHVKGSLRINYVPVTKIETPKETIFNTCSDGTVCSKDETCCKTKSGEYGCCPYVEGTCCPDGVHCCPGDTKCDEVHKECVKKSLDYSRKETKTFGLMYNIVSSKFENVDVLLTLTESHSTTSVKERKESKHVCPNRKDTCNDNSTCCQLSDGSYGCCPTVQGVCCPDKKTCCPHGMMCNQGSCSYYLSDALGALTNSQSTKAPAKTQKETVIACPNGIDECNDDSTCCELPDGNYGCCPTVQGVCCPDKTTCCRHGTKCQKGGCVEFSLPNAILSFMAVPRLPLL